MLGFKEKPIIISVGGSLLVPGDKVDSLFLRHLNDFIRRHVAKGKRFFLVTGGGKIARSYRDAGKEVVGDISDEDLDWIAIHATRLNAHLLRTIFQDIAHPRTIENYDRRLINWREPVVIGAGWKPGWSTDYDAVKLAQDYGGNLIINLSNIDWVYDKDPRTSHDAKPIKKLTWEEMEELVGTKWKPGINAPFDPVATQLAKRLGITVIVTNGKDFHNLEKILEGESFKGTVIMPYRIDASFYDREYYMGKKGAYRIAPVGSLYNRIIQALANWYRAFLIKIFLNPKTSLDVGCGTGRLVKYLRMLGVDAYGVELSNDVLELAEPASKPYLRQGDIGRLPYEENQFDLVLTFDVLEHVERSKIKKAIEETVRVSRKHILHKIYTKENLWINLFHSRDFSHISVFDRKYWQRLFHELPHVSVLRSSFFKLPSFIETIFLLKKTS
ncbi:UMP kinase [Candidatus Roizmanbacteria bacterium]|nr:UMP kinase [Candidatus Roizmanbacteria bacterium]